MRLTSAQGRAAAIVTALALISTLCGCAQHARVICEPLALVYEGEPGAAVVALDETDVAGSGNDRFLYHAQRGHLLHLAGEYEASNAEFERAVAVAHELEPWSVTGTLTDYTLNEAVKAYAGEDYERAYLHYYMALNYLMLDDLEGALVECRRLDEVFRELDARYEEGTRRYQDDGFIRYLSGLIYEAQGKTNDAFIDYKLAARVYEGETGEAVGVAMPAGLFESLVCTGRALGMEDQVEALLGVTAFEPAAGESTAVDSSAVRVRGAESSVGDCEEPPAEIIVLIDAGWAPFKEEESIQVPIHRAFVPEDLRGGTNLAALVKIAYPVLVSVPGAIGEYGATATDTARADSLRAHAGGFTVTGAERVQDMDALARWALHRRIGAIKFRSTLRATAKQVALMKAKHDEEDEEKPFATPFKRHGFWRGVLGWIFEDIVTHAVAETEQADTRSWVTLPAEIWMARIPVAPGAYEVSVSPHGAGPVSLGVVEVGRGEKAFRACRVLGGPHPVRCD